MSKILPKTSLVCLALLFSGCAIGNRYDYQSLRPSLPKASGKTTVAVATVDHREDFLSTHVASNYVGMTRGWFGIPFRVYTLSHAPLAEDVTKAMVSSFNAAGYKSEAVSDFPAIDVKAAKGKLMDTHANRHVLITIHKWESDTMVNTDLTMEIDVKVYDRSGDLIAEEHKSISKELTGKLFAPLANTKETLRSEITTLLARIFASDKISNAL